MIVNTQIYLCQIKILDTKIKQKQEQYNQLYESAHSIGAVRYDREPVQTSKTNDAIERSIIRYLELEEEIKDETLNFQKTKHKIINEIQELDDDRFINLLYKKYVEYKPMNMIAEEMCYSYDYVKELHRNSLKAFEDKHPTISHHEV